MFILPVERDNLSQETTQFRGRFIRASMDNEHVVCFANMFEKCWDMNRLTTCTPVAPFIDMILLKSPHGHVIKSIVKSAIKLLIFQPSTTTPLKFEIGWVISSHTALTLSQWSSSGNPVYTAMPLEKELLVASVLPVVFRWLSSGLPLCSNYANEHWIATGTPLGAGISQCGSSGIPMYLWLQWSSSVFQLGKLTLDRHCNTTGC